MVPVIASTLNAAIAIIWFLNRFIFDLLSFEDLIETRISHASSGAIATSPTSKLCHGPIGSRAHAILIGMEMLH
jgi:hypothetical protein